ncbi:MAG: NAD-dependent epimerase/dehydratase family protein, partial [Candidatus Thermoplasmatota archaeon]|nr:NAD-dependent epimerase/dehydratase family protein [Candidatus Thermoplasmatota archaeon]
MRAFVTGGSGHVGGNLVRELISRGYGVKCLVRK